MKNLLLIAFTLFSLLAQAQTVPYGYNSEVGKYFDVGNNTNLYYEIYGEGEPLLMLHGGVYGYIDEFGVLIPKLTEKYQVICLGTRGHVKSDIGNEAFTYDQRASDAYKLIKHLKIEKPVTVIGFSDGGYSAYKLAANYPETVEKMIVMGAADDPQKAGKEVSAYTAEGLMNDLSDYFKNRVANMPEPNRWGESLEMLNDLYNNSIVSEETFKKIQCPVLIMSGDSDEYANPEACLAAHRYLPKSILSIIPSCGHVILYCNFPAVWESMRPFLGIR